jgi:hypothetical protein
MPYKCRNKAYTGSPAMRAGMGKFGQSRRVHYPGAKCFIFNRQLSISKYGFDHFGVLQFHNDLYFI